MRNFYSTLRQCFCVVLPCAAMLSACTKDNSANVAPSRPTIGFAVSAPSVFTSSDGRCGGELVSCANLALEGGTKPMFIHALTDEGIATSVSDANDTSISRGEPLTEATLTDAGVVAFNFKGEWSDALAPQFMYDKRIAKSSDWKTDVRYPNDASKVRFYAYAPYACKGATLSGKDAAGVPSIGYTVPAAVAEQQDLMVAVSKDVVSNASTDKTDLAFRHALAAVRFATGDDIASGTLRSIKLKGIYTKGTCRIGDAPVWSDLSATGDFVLTDLNKWIDGTKDASITTAAQTFMMIPQTLPDGASIEVVMVVDGTEQTLSCKLAGSAWVAGCTTTYRISSSSITGEPVFEVIAPASFNYKGGTQSCTVSSYKLHTDGTKVPVKWLVLGYSADGGRTWDDVCPSWLTLPQNGGGTAVQESCSITVTPQIADISRHDKLSQAEPVASTYDLSTKGGTAPMNTANCYVINAAGKYSIPLVYGNGIKNGARNPSAYTIAAPEGYTNILSPLVNHRAEAITSPYIYENEGCVPGKVYLVWQEKVGLIRNLALAADRHSLTFEVPRANIDQGNALIEVRDTLNQTMWSWHLWVTDHHLGDGDVAITTKKGLKFDMMPLNLGCCYTKTTAERYNERSVIVRFRQESGKGIERTITVYQSPYVEDSALISSCPFYQWGRKDPMPPSDGSVNSYEKTIYTYEGEVLGRLEPHYDIGEGTRNIQIGILSPDSFGVREKFNIEYDNLWNMQLTQAQFEQSVRKTIYDPSPVGYCVPPMAAFDNFLEGTRSSSLWRHGWTYFCDASHNTTIYFPADGYRSDYDKSTAYGQPTAVTTHGWYATATPHSSVFGFAYSQANAFHLQQNFASEVTYKPRMAAITLRCVKEQ